MNNDRTNPVQNPLENRMNSTPTTLTNPTPTPHPEPALPDLACAANHPLTHLLKDAAAMEQAGRLLGAGLCAHLDLTELTFLASDQARSATALGAPFQLDYLEELPHPALDWASWEAEVLRDTDVDPLLWRNTGLWLHLYVAVERHVEAAAEDVTDVADGTVWLVPASHRGAYVWDRTELPGAYLPEGNDAIGRHVVYVGGLPDVYLRGIARGIAEVATDVLAVIDQTGGQS